MIAVNFVKLIMPSIILAPANKFFSKSATTDYLTDSTPFLGDEYFLSGSLRCSVCLTLQNFLHGDLPKSAAGEYIMQDFSKKENLSILFTGISKLRIHGSAEKLPAHWKKRK